MANARLPLPLPHAAPESQSVASPTGGVAISACSRQREGPSGSPVGTNGPGIDGVASSNGGRTHEHTV